MRYQNRAQAAHDVQFKQKIQALEERRQKLESGEEILPEKDPIEYLNGLIEGKIKPPHKKNLEELKKDLENYQKNARFKKFDIEIGHYKREIEEQLQE